MNCRHWRLLLLEVLAFRPKGLELPPGRCRRPMSVSTTCVSPSRVAPQGRAWKKLSTTIFGYRRYLEGPVDERRRRQRPRNIWRIRPERALQRRTLVIAVQQKVSHQGSSTLLARAKGTRRLNRWPNAEAAGHRSNQDHNQGQVRHSSLHARKAMRTETLG